MRVGAYNRLFQAKLQVKTTIAPLNRSGITPCSVSDAEAPLDQVPYPIHIQAFLWYSSILSEKCSAAPPPCFVHTSDGRRRAPTTRHAHCGTAVDSAGKDHRCRNDCRPTRRRRRSTNDTIRHRRRFRRRRHRVVGGCLHRCRQQEPRHKGEGDHHFVAATVWTAAA